MSNMKSKQTIISVKHLSKEFKLPHERHSSLKSTIINFRKRNYETFHALTDINFEVHRGEFFGILGRNGSGKSTLLKLLGGIYSPTHGSVHVDGTLTPFIELGVGFNPELTGRENIFLNGVILGLTQQEVEEKYEEIVAFAELERFMDQKLKNYSSGMQVRLAFSIAIQAHNVVLLIDEVLAVGDERFQRKCVDVFNTIKRDPNKTVVFVSHDMGAVQRFCDRAIVIHDSKLVFEGGTQEAVYEYKKLNFPELVEDSSSHKLEKSRWGSQRVVASDIKAVEKRHAVKNDILITMKIRVNDKAIEGEPIVCGLAFSGEDGVSIAGPNSSTEKPPVTAHNGQLTFTVENHHLNSGTFDVTVVLEDAEGNTLDHHDKVVKLSVARKTREMGMTIMGGRWHQK